MDHKLQNKNLDHNKNMDHKLLKVIHYYIWKMFSNFKVEIFEILSFLKKAEIHTKPYGK